MIAQRYGLEEGTTEEGFPASKTNILLKRISI